ncbi:MAG TPA: hypothetical protein VL405_01650 [Sphingomonas sp.]|nr:hypothetical protein [Sphingomonas sp.]
MAAQDASSLEALTAAPAHHRVLLENDHVRVLDTAVAAGERTPVHRHDWPAVLQVVSWSDFVRYTPDGRVLADSRRDGLSAQPGSLLWGQPLPPHYVENVGDTVLHIIAFEIKGGA